MILNFRYFNCNTPRLKIYRKELGIDLDVKRNNVELVKKHVGIDTLASLLWISFGLMGGFSYYSKRDYLICGIFLLVAILHGYKLFKSKREKARNHGN